jgi:DNA-binding protein HU-beta
VFQPTILGASMNKSELINSLSEETTYSKKDVSRMLDSLVRIIQRTLKKGDKMQWAGFGTWQVSARPARTAMNPVTKQKITVPATRVPRFKPAKMFKEVIKSV